MVPLYHTAKRCKTYNVIKIFSKPKNRDEVSRKSRDIKHIIKVEIVIQIYSTREIGGDHGSIMDSNTNIFDFH